MARKVRRHPLEDWADLFARNDTTDMLINGTLLPGLRDGEGKSHIMPSNHLAHASTIVFAHMLRKGQGHIVRIADEMYEDVIASKFDEGAESENGMLPWHVFAIELRRDTNWQAIVVTTWANTRSRLEDALRSFTNDTLDEMDKYLEELDAIAERIAAEYTEAPVDAGEIPIIAPIPNDARMRSQAVAAAEHVAATMHRTSHTPATDMATLTDTFLRKLPKVPLELGWGKTENQMAGNEMLSLAMFVLAKNTDIRTTYEPNPKLPDNPKKRRSKASMHEVGFEWTEAYRRYREAVRTDGLGGHVRPHTRRGHFHRFRTGPRDSEKPTYVTHWIPPILVGGGATSNTGHIMRRERN